MLNGVYEMITVAIPVGPFPGCVKWLDEAIDSCLQQTPAVGEILLIDDMAGLPDNYRGCTTYKTPWRIGPAAAFNFGVALAKYERVIMLGSDDKLLPGCIDICNKAYTKNKEQDAYYWFNIVYNDGEEQGAACNAAMVTKGLWCFNGGFPVESACGAMDSILISIMLKNDGKAGWFFHIMGPPIYWVRRHPEQDTAYRGPWQGVIFSTRNILTEIWTKPEWPNFNAKEYLTH